MEVGGDLVSSLKSNADLSEGAGTGNRSGRSRAAMADRPFSIRSSRETSSSAMYPAPEMLRGTRLQTALGKAVTSASNYRRFRNGCRLE